MDKVRLKQKFPPWDPWNRPLAFGLAEIVFKPTDSADGTRKISIRTPSCTDRVFPLLIPHPGLENGHPKTGNTKKDRD